MIALLPHLPRVVQHLSLPEATEDQGISTTDMSVLILDMVVAATAVASVVSMGWILAGDLAEEEEEEEAVEALLTGD
jgi:hypothetical protein